LATTQDLEAASSQILVEPPHQRGFISATTAPKQASPRFATRTKNKNSIHFWSVAWTATRRSVQPSWLFDTIVAEQGTYLAKVWG